ncbi:MAG: GTP pyrophosphokinase family protein [Eubacterium sp.]|nr:GTP pyrophosphokinase family protein [Eubacterium sp.]
MSSIYGPYEPRLIYVMNQLQTELESYDRMRFEETGDHIFEHISARIKTDQSMREKCRRKNLMETPYSALHELQDAIGIRVICAFRDDIYGILEHIRTLPGVTIAEEIDYIRHAKPNGYRSYHLILSVETAFEDVEGKVPGHYFVEVQLRTIAMDSWASLEHKMKYKKDIRNQELIEAELKRCADEMAACDVSLETIRNLIRNS